MKTNRHSLMAKGIMVLFTLLVLIFAITYAWYSTAQPEASAYGLSVSTTASFPFDVAVGFQSYATLNNYKVSDFSKTINLTNLTVTGDGTYNLLADFSPKDITGDGRNFYIPLLETNQYGEKNIAAGTSSYSDVTPNIEYISFDMIFRCIQECRVYIDEESIVKGRCEAEAGNGALNVGEANLSTTDLLNHYQIINDQGVQVDATPEQVYNKSSYGDFSRDAVVGAIRVGFVDYDSQMMTIDNIFDNIADDAYNNFLNPSAEFVWLPRPDIFLEQPATPEGTKENWVLHTSDESDFVENYWDETSQHKYYDLSEKTMKPVTTYTETNVIPIVPVTIPYDSDDDGTTDYYLGKVRVNIWVEGTDAEARRAISAGQFDIHFDLRAG